MYIEDKPKLIGTLSIYGDWGRGKELIFTEENLVTLATRQLILSWIHGTAVTTDPINGIKVGTGGTIDPAGLFPKQEDENWTALNTTITTIGTGGLVSIAKTVDNTVPKVTFLADIDQSTANGSLISEAGLFRTSGSIFNVKTFPAIPKTSDFSLHFEWAIKLV